MLFGWNARDPLSLGQEFLRWVIFALPIGVLTGTACALFLVSLNLMTKLRLEHPWLLFLLPVAGVVVSAMYQRWGRTIEAGNNLIMDEIHTPGGGVPARLAPLVLVGTLLTHLFGGSAGREGTAVQMGGAIAGYYTRLVGRFTPEQIRILLMTGIAAGFGGVFGTPVAGAIFALEVLSIGQMSYAAIVPCLTASILADAVCAAWGVHHTSYRFAGLTDSMARPEMSLDWLLLAKVALASIAFGFVAYLFATLTHGTGHLFKRYIPNPLLRPLIGGLIIIAGVYLLGTRDYLGIGVDSSDPAAVTILSSFRPGGAHAWSWWWKLLFTAITLGSGFKGGEVTPLFFIGAALGNTLAWLLGAPVELFAALGFVAVFAGATNTPLACTIMAMELFGPTHIPYFAVACFLAYLFSGHHGIYLSQRIGTPKIDSPKLPPDVALRDAHAEKEEL